MKPRFTIDGSDALEAHLAAACKTVLSRVRELIPVARLEGVLLGGGYGRGEGGVMKSPGGDQPYNDLEFYVFIRGNAILAERKFRQPLHELGECLSPEACLDVEFKVLTLGKLAGSPPSMFYYDLVAGHRWILGDDTLLALCEHHRDASLIPLHEATRLLFNRCSGLLYSLERLRRKDFGEAEADFVGRNLAKAQLAFGDVLLTARGQYHWSCRERHERLLACHFEGSLAWAEALKTEHAQGVAFKLHPTQSRETRETLAARHAALADLGRQLWLWLESKRLGIPLRSPRDYAFSPPNKCPETSAGRNRLVNLRAFGPAGLACARYPRERLFNALTLLLWEPAVVTDPALLGKIQAELQTNANDFAGLVAAFQQLWNRFN
jgi:hypothetical protein